MKSLSLILLLSTAILAECTSTYNTFKVDEQAYLQVKKINVASFKADEIFKKYLESSHTLLEECPNTISLDKQYVLKRELKKLEKDSEKYKVAQLYEIRKNALGSRDTITVYRNGTITPVR